MKKAITILLIFILLSTAILQNRVWARDVEKFNQIQSGTSNRNGETESIQASEGTNSLIGTVLTYCIYPVGSVINALLALVIQSETGIKIQLFTIEDLLFGRYELFNIDFMSVGQNSEASNPAYMSSNTNVLIKENVARWFYSMRNFAIAALLAVLIYIGILMAISSVATDKAKYKNMLIHWVASFALLILLPYIMSIAMNVCQVSVDVIRTTAEKIAENTNMAGQVANENIETQKGLNFETTLLYGKIDEEGNGFEGLLTKIAKGYGWESFTLALVFLILSIYQFKFFFMYLKRMLTVAFLMVISPLITITYSIDKAGDNQAQAYKTWIKEFLVNLFIQPLHALLFLIFMYSVYGIMERAPLLAIVFLASLSRGEQLVRKIFKIERTASVGKLRRK